MKTATKKLALALLTLCITAHAQTEPHKNTEAEIFAKHKAMQAECDKIAKVVPCAVGVGGVKDLQAALIDAESDARYKLAQTVKVFVSYAIKDTSFIEGVESQRLKQISGKINIDSLALSNSQTTAIEYGIVTDEITGNKFYRVLTLMVLNPQLYQEAQKEIIPLTEPLSSSSTATPSSSSTKQIAQPAAQPTPIAEQQKIDYKKTAKRIATKVVKFILGLIL